MLSQLIESFMLEQAKNGVISHAISITKFANSQPHLGAVFSCLSS
ncbi:hypothetical protein [Haemophilus influenzae]